jgi:flagellar basal-body rod protein FlgB
MKTDFTVDILARAMSMRLKRHGAIAGNIANAETPGYRPQQVAFEDQLQEVVKSGSTDRLHNMRAKVLTVDDVTPRQDGNSVDLDRQMAGLAENSLMYNAAAEFMARKMRMIKSVIS